LYKYNSRVPVLLFCAAAIGGALNAVAGGGSFLTLPALILAGVSPVTANATSTLALWPASLSSTFAYRADIKASRQWMVVLGLTSVAGGLAGALLLVRTSDSSFLRLLPWLMLTAAATFTFGSRLRRADWHPGLAIVVVVQFFIATYGGYFGGGMGIMMLATFALAGMTNIHEMNGLKSVLAVAINALALVEFILKGAVAWEPGLLMVVGAVLGGYFGATGARLVDPKFVRLFIIGIGWAMTAYFFLR